jgi:NTP pyrophosphatase (non-canonical NTP hydrolase)
VSISIPSNATFGTEKMPKPSAAIKRLPVVVRDRMPATPMPVQYEEACRLLAECLTLDESKLWADRADMLAAWAKLYKSDEAAIAARRLKLKAFRKMGELAEEIAKERNDALVEQKRVEAAALILQLRDQAAKLKADGELAKAEKLRRKAKDIARSDKPLIGSCRLPTGHSVLVNEHGLKPSAAIQVMNVARAPRKVHERLVASGATASAAQRAGRGHGHVPKRSSDAWMWLAYTPGMALLSVWSQTKKRRGGDVAANIAPSEVKQARTLVIALTEWLDEFEQRLPK